MRVYGASPIYNLVEFLFRFRRLFVICVVASTLTVGWAAYMHAGTYTAKALVVLSGSPASADAERGPAAPDRVRSRLNMLTALQRDPDFIKGAIRAAIDEEVQPESTLRHVWPKTGERVVYHFAPDKSEAAVGRISRDAMQALRVSEKEGIAEISCRWPDAHAADVVNAFYWAFHDAVVSYETADSKMQEDLLAKLLDDHMATEQRISAKLNRYRHAHVADLPDDAPGGAETYTALAKSVEDLKANVVLLQERRDTYATQLKTIAPTIKSMEVYGKPTDTPLYAAALQKRTEAQTALDGLKARYEDKHPRVQEAQRALDAADDQLRRADAASRATPNIQQTTSIPNPEYTRTVSIVHQADADLKGMRATLDLKQKQADAQKLRTLAAGPRTSELKWLTEQSGALRATRASLETRLQAAQLTRKQQYLRASLETSLLGRPVPEPEQTGSSALLVCVLGPLLGAVIAVVLSQFADRMDHTLRTPLEVEARLGKPVLAVLPRGEGAGRARRQLNSGVDRGQHTLPPML